WALGAATGLFLVQLLQPLSLALTSLMFLAAGLAVGSRGAIRRAFVVPRLVAVLLAAGLVFTALDFAASAFESYGNTYGSQAALRTAQSMAPWRLLTPLLLARERAFNFREGDLRAASDSRRLATSAIRRHSWNPMVRLTAA